MWSKVNVGLPEAADDRNHYDDDLPVQDLEEGQEASGIFMGLEVLEDYRLDGRRIIVNESQQQHQQQQQVATSKSKTAKKTKPKKESSKNKSPKSPALKTPDTNLQKSIKLGPLQKSDISDNDNEKEGSNEYERVIGQNWLSETGVSLRPELCRSLADRHFVNPTPIQKRVLPCAIHGRRNIVGAAPTGSGKTLAFLLPIFQTMETAPSGQLLLALILTPTRELALQITREAKLLDHASSSVVCITGGLAVHKQKRVLQNRRPSVVVATPGRLWELYNSRDHHHLNNLSGLRFLVVDEADRLFQPGSFKELKFVLDAVERANPMAHFVDQSKGDKESQKRKPSVHRQTLVFSATLTRHVDVNEILEKARAKGPSKIIDLSAKSSQRRQGEKGSAVGTSAFQLPPGLCLQEIKCTQRHKDAFLYAYLVQTKSPALIFCNSVAGVRRVGSVLRTLGLSVRVLHARMQQRSRFKAVESLKDQSIVVSTDVAARGLDIGAVATVIHYDMARSVDTFVHRAGRTARGMGDAAVGCSLSLVSSNEDRIHGTIINELNVKFDTVPMDGRFLSSAQERVNLATKVASEEGKSQKRKLDNQWFKQQAEAAGLECDDLIQEEGAQDDKEVARTREAETSRLRLKKLLLVPMQAQRFGKFLSTITPMTQSSVRIASTTALDRKTKRKKRSK